MVVELAYFIIITTIIILVVGDCEQLLDVRKTPPMFIIVCGIHFNLASNILLYL